MVEIVYANQQKSFANARVTGVGSQTGPPGGDGWQIVDVLASSTMFGTGQYAIIVSGQFGDSLIVGSTPVWGTVQLCLGTTAGLRHPEFLTMLPLVFPLAPMRGQPFQFLVLISSSFPDSLFGSSFNPATTSLCLWARTFTNGDPQAYSSEFTIADVVWQVWNLDEIPAGEWIADTTSPASPIPLPGSLPATFTRLSPTAAASGGNGGVWLHYVNYWLRALGPNVNAPYLRSGITPDGTEGAFITKIGANNRWGLRRHASTPTVGGAWTSEHHLGGFFVHQNTTSTAKVGFFGHDGGAPTLVLRWRYFAVRIDTLPDVRFVSTPTLQFAGGPLSGPWEESFITIERPAAGILTEPIVMTHFTAVVPPNPVAYGVVVTEAGNGQSMSFGQTDCFPRADPSRQEAVSSMAHGWRTFQTTSQAMQWRVHAVGDPGCPPGPAGIWDFNFVQFHPTRDPENLTSPPGSKPPPVVIAPGKQSLDAASLPLPLFAPNANPLQRGADVREAIRGGTGYRRSWPIGTKILRQFTVSWGPMPEEDGHELLVFLRTNVAWRYLPPRGAAIAVLNLANPELAPAGHRAVTVTVEVGVAVFTGV